MNPRAALPIALLALLGAAGTARADVAADTARALAADSTPAPAAAPLPGVDLNRATRAQLVALPVAPAIADGIIDRRTYLGWFTSVFDLYDVPGMTPELFARLRARVVVSPVFEAKRQEGEEEQRVGDLNYLVQRLLSEEGASEGLVDSYVDQIRDPRDVNGLDYFDLASYENLSPVDATAIMRERQLAGRIENERQLRATPGLSYWGFRNVRDFVTYAPRDSGGSRLHVDAQWRTYDTPYTADDADVLTSNLINDTSGLTADQAQAFKNFQLDTYAGRLGLGLSDPALTQKVRARWGPHWSGGWLASRNVGEQAWNSTLKGFAAVEDLKPIATPLGPLTLQRAVAGSYAVTFGLGLVMDATDFFSARRTGFGYSVRPLGLRGDLSRTDEYGLNGLGLEATLGRLRATMFGSQARKDAILNPDGSFNRYMSMVPRVPNDVLDEIRQDILDGTFAGRGDAAAYFPMRDVMDERVLGTNVRWEFAPGTYVGATGVDIRTRNRAFSGALADRFNPDPNTLVIDPNRIEDRDAEIGGAYDSRALGDYRRIWGAEGQGVWRNLSLAGEYGKLETSTRSSALARVFSNGPQAFVTQGYAQWENLTLLALYRDYDIGYDDPYDRAFSEDSRYEQTILDGNAYRLNNPYWAMLARDDPTPKAERGWYFNTRWQPLRDFLVSGFEYDTWIRKADNADMSRVVARLEYRPIFPIRIRLRQAMSARHADRPDDIRAYRQWDSRIELLANLSRFDQLRFLYSTTNVMFAARGRLSGPAAGGDVQSDTTAQRGSPATALQAQFTHQFTPDIALTLSSEVYDGFLWNYEDNEFLVVDGKGFRNWVMLRSRLSPHLSWRFKWTTDHALSRTYVDIRNFGSLVSPTPDATDARGDASAFRLQLDLSL
ncbi:MAG TPA: helix-hairpin-helix domain-containing protein [Candidatus Eisenbacteria bacterium]|nr:helix-hairpin-helix domain-containing protein [Candidatus Eisenbacteria bacterium]